MLLQVIFVLTGQGASNRIPSMLRRQPKLFFQGFEQLRARAAKVHKENPDLGMTAVAGTGGAALAGAAVAGTGGGMPVGSSAAAAGAGDKGEPAEVATDLVAKVALLLFCIAAPTPFAVIEATAAADTIGVTR